MTRNLRTKIIQHRRWGPLQQGFKIYPYLLVWREKKKTKNIWAIKVTTIWFRAYLQLTLERLEITKVCVYTTCLMLLTDTVCLAMHIHRRPVRLEGGISLSHYWVSLRRVKYINLLCCSDATVNTDRKSCLSCCPCHLKCGQNIIHEKTYS